MNIIKKIYQLPKNLIQTIYRCERIQKETLYSQIFSNSITSSKWLRDTNFSPSGAAANYSFLYILFKVLDLCQPKTIIEFGIGQTSQMTTQYIKNNSNKDNSLWLVEHDKLWIDIFSDKVCSPDDKIKLLHLPTETIFFKKHSSQAYRGLEKEIGNKKFNLIINDGPHGTTRFSRIGILSLIPNNLEKSFVIIIDDCDRKGEMETAKEILKKLKSSNIDHCHTILSGIKNQVIIYSSDNKFLETI
ncbi:MAG: hypothetical protein ACT6FE_05970 [Methanosarcinaceae archaeon]